MVTPVLIGLHVTWESFGTNRKEGQTTSGFPVHALLFTHSFAISCILIAITISVCILIVIPILLRCCIHSVVRCAQLSQPETGVAIRLLTIFFYYGMHYLIFAGSRRLRFNRRRLPSNRHRWPSNRWRTGQGTGGFG